MKTEDANGLPSFRRLYMEISDPTEYRVANELLGGWEHWQVLNSSQWFEEFITPIREELKVKVWSDILLEAYKTSVSGERGATTAAKFLADAIKTKRGQGRPSKEEVANETKRQAAIKERLNKDAERLGINLIVDND